ncbi:MAG: hypothetical protein WCQ87_07360, partial [Parabacteroides sp.]
SLVARGMNLKSKESFSEACSVLKVIVSKSFLLFSVEQEDRKKKIGSIINLQKISVEFFMSSI